MQVGSILGSHLLQVELVHVVVMVHVLLVLFVPMIVILQMVTSTIGSGAVVVIMLLLMVVSMGNVYPGVGVADVSGFRDGVGTWWYWCV